MKNRINKPKVFLSHAWENKVFIEKVATDLRRCWIDYWLDTEEIRDGHSWLKVIFEDGIPTCDAVIVYLTKESLDSKMVEKELDAAVVHQLSENGVTLLPYVSESNLRGHLRSDIQPLQCREWNDDNYESVLPTVVAEIWRSYLERTVETAVLQEKNRRLQQELENKRLIEQYQSSVFSPREEQEFLYLYDQLSKRIEVKFDLYEKKDGDKSSSQVGEEVCRLSVLYLLQAIMDNGEIYFDSRRLGFHLLATLGETSDTHNHEIVRRFGRILDTKVAAKIHTELNTYGLTKQTRIASRDRWEVVYEITDKMYRLKYWMEYKNLLLDEPLDHIVTMFPEKPKPSDPQQSDKHSVTAEALAADKKISEARRRKTWSSSGEGTLAATKDIQAMFDDLNARVTASNEVLEHIKLAFYSDLNSCSITTGDLTLLLKWNCPTRNTMDCVLTVLISAANPQIEPESESLSKQVFTCEFGLKISNALQVLWYRKDTHDDPCSITKLAQYCWTTFFGFAQRHEEGPL